MKQVNICENIALANVSELTNSISVYTYSLLFDNMPAVTIV